MSSRKQYTEVKAHLEYLPEGWIEDRIDKKFCFPNIVQPKENIEYIHCLQAETLQSVFPHTY